MAERLFLSSKLVALAGNGSGSIQIEADARTTFVIERLFITSTGQFAITNIQDEQGDRYTDADSTDYIEGSSFNDSASDNNVPADLPIPITVRGNGTLTFTFLDLSGSANSVRLVAFGRRITD